MGDNKRRGLASASQETRDRVAKSGGDAIHRKRGLAAADEETRQRVSSMGGEARAQDREGMAEAGRKGGKKVVEKYGIDHFRTMGHKGGNTVKDSYGPDYFAELGKKGGEVVKQKGEQYFSEIGKLGGEARALTRKRGDIGDGRTADD